MKPAHARRGPHYREIQMRIITILAALFIAFSFTGLAEEKKAADKLVFQAKMGNVTFDHAKHTERAKGDCKVCHDKLWPQDAKAPLNFKAGMHKVAEKGKTSCATCHVAGGASFVSTGNCAKCHVKGAK